MITNYEVTIRVSDPTRVKEWQEWMTKVHIPHVLKTGIPLKGSGKIYLVEEMEQNEPSTTFVVNYHFASKEDLLTYRTEHGKRLGQEYEEAGWAVATEVSRRIITPV